MAHFFPYFNSFINIKKPIIRRLLLLPLVIKHQNITDMLSNKDIEQFILSGYVRIDHAFSQETANAALDILWNDLPYERSDPSTWTEPVIRLGMYTQQPFIESLNTPSVKLAFNQL